MKTILLYYFNFILAANSLNIQALEKKLKELKDKDKKTRKKLENEEFRRNLLEKDKNVAYTRKTYAYDTYSEARRKYNEYTQMDDTKSVLYFDQNKRNEEYQEAIRTFNSISTDLVQCMNAIEGYKFDLIYFDVAITGEECILKNAKNKK